MRWKRSKSPLLEFLKGLKNLLNLKFFFFFLIKEKNKQNCISSMFFSKRPMPPNQTAWEECPRSQSNHLLGYKASPPPVWKGETPASIRLSANLAGSVSSGWLELGRCVKMAARGGGGGGGEEGTQTRSCPHWICFADMLGNKKAERTLIRR